jgi:hypothetical protein
MFECPAGCQLRLGASSLVLCQAGPMGAAAGHSLMVKSAVLAHIDLLRWVLVLRLQYACDPSQLLIFTR